MDGQIEALDRQKVEMQQTREILTGETAYLKESTEYQRQNLLILRIDEIEQRIYKLCSSIEEKYTFISSVQGEGYIETLDRYILTCIEADTFEDLKVVMDDYYFVDLVDLIGGYLSAANKIEDEIFISSRIKSLKESIERVRGVI